MQLSLYNPLKLLLGCIERIEISVRVVWSTGAVEVHTNILRIWQALIGRNLTKYEGTARQAFCRNDWTRYWLCYFSFLLARYLIRPSFRHANWNEWFTPFRPLIGGWPRRVKQSTDYAVLWLVDFIWTDTSDMIHSNAWPSAERLKTLTALHAGLSIVKKVFSVK